MSLADVSERARLQTLGVSPNIELHWCGWGEDSVVLEARSGQLFQFDALSAAVMACFEEAPQRLDRVVDSLSLDLGMTSNDALQETVRDVVQEFRRMGWLEPIIDP